MKYITINGIQAYVVYMICSMHGPMSLMLYFKGNWVCLQFQGYGKSTRAVHILRTPSGRLGGLLWVVIWCTFFLFYYYQISQYPYCSHNWKSILVYLIETTKYTHTHILVNDKYWKLQAKGLPYFQEMKVCYTQMFDKPYHPSDWLPNHLLSLSFTLLANKSRHFQSHYYFKSLTILLRWKQGVAITSTKKQ